MGSSISTFEAVLGLLEVKHTESFTDQYFNEHPYRYNLLGLSIKAHRKAGTLNLLKKAVFISALGMTVILVSIFAAGCSSNDQAKDGLPFIDVRRNNVDRIIYDEEKDDVFVCDLICILG